jgi:branched-chain amino acid transport system ATP-binding protein
VSPPIRPTTEGNSIDDLQGGESTERAQAGAILEVRSLVSGYRDLQVLRDMSLTADSGKVELVLGRNGAGKTTLLCAIAGLLPIWSGTLHFNGQDVGRLPAYRRQKTGISLVLEGKRIFRTISVHDNLVVGCHGQRIGRKAIAQKIDALVSQLSLLGPLMGRVAGSLSGGQQQILAIAQALMGDPKVLLLDEPSAGLSPAMVDDVFEIIAGLATQGLCIVLVEQIVERVVGFADHVVVMDDGHVVVEGGPEVTRDMDVLRSAYFGQTDKT